MANPVIHFEIPVGATKLNKVKRFYEDIFGWKIEKVPKMPYWTVQTEKTNPRTRMPEKRGMINGGMMKKNGEPGPVIVLQVKNVKNHLKKAEERGARVMSKIMEVEGMGLYARIKDPAGNLIGLWQNK